MNADHDSRTTDDGDTTPRAPLARALLRLVDQSLWANITWVDFVYSQPDPEVRPRELLAHLMIGERIWFERIEGEPKTTVFFAVLSQDELLRGFKENADVFRRLITSQLDDDIPFRRGTGEQYHARVIDIIHHLLTHGYHHRGQLAGHHARSGMRYPNTDHINFLIVNQL